MSAFSGEQYPGAMSDRSKTKREEAEARNALTPYERTRQYRRDQLAQAQS